MIFEEEGSNEKKKEGVGGDEGMGVKKRKYWRGRRKKGWREEQRRKGL